MESFNVTSDVQNILPYNYQDCHIKTAYNSYKIVFIGLQKTEGNSFNFMSD